VVVSGVDDGIGSGDVRVVPVSNTHGVGSADGVGSNGSLLSSAAEHMPSKLFQRFDLDRDGECRER